MSIKGCGMPSIKALEDQFILEHKTGLACNGGTMSHESELALRHGFMSGALAIQSASYDEGYNKAQRNIREAIGIFDRGEAS